MSTSDDKPEVPPEFGPENRHVVHFYDDGNLLLDVNGMLFQVHKSILKRKSQTFRDMFSLSHAGGSTDGPVETITLHDDPHKFAKLLDILYDGFEFSRVASLRQCLEVLELAQKYEMVDLENTLNAYLEKKLPVSASDPLDLHVRYRHYNNDHSLAPLVLRVGSSKLVPWAFYAFGVHLTSNFNPVDKATYNPPPELSAVDSSYTYPLILLQRIISHTLTNWRIQTTQFFQKGCSQAAGRGPSCLRYGRELTAQDNLYLSPEQNPLDPVTWIGNTMKVFEADRSRHRGPYHGWCAACPNTLRDTIRSTFLEIHPYLVECVAQLKGRPVSGDDS